MATIHIAEAEAEPNFGAVMAHVRAGADVVIEDAGVTVAVVSSPSMSPPSGEEILPIACSTTSRPLPGIRTLRYQPSG